MGKKSNARGSVGPFGTRRTSGLLRHINEQTLDGTATTEVAEAIANPAFGRGGVHTGMEIARIMVVPAVASTAFASQGAGGFFICQLQLGDQSATPVVIDPNSENLFAHLHHISALTTSGATAIQFPMMVPIVNVVPIIVEQYLTVTWQAAAVATVYNSQKVFTVIDYFTVDVPDSVYTSIVLSHRDQS